MVGAVAALLFGFEATATAADILTIGVRDGWVLPVPIAPVQISISDTDIADIKLISPKRLLVTAKKLGQARVILIDRNNRVKHYVVNVVVPVSGLAARINNLLVGQSVKVQAVGNTVVLSGEVDSPRIADRASKMAEAHLKAVGQAGAKVLNFLSVRGRQQVQLRVKVAEVSRTSLRQMGINTWYRSNLRAAGMLASPLGKETAPDLGTTGNTLHPGGQVPLATGDRAPAIPMLAAPFPNSFGLFFSTQDSSSFPLSIALSLLQGKGLAKVLSEPTVVAYSGQEASFLAGGEFPIPVPQGLGQTGIEFKKFGVQLGFTPMILGDSNIRMKIDVAVSQPDQANGVDIQGTRVPALATRQSATTVHLKNGQSFAIAGLLQSRVESSSTRVPLLGDLPIIGMLFRRTEFSRTESELVILVTAYLVSPLQPGEVPPLPGEDELSDPGALRFFLLGTTDAEDRHRPRRGPAGPVGFAR